MAMLNLGIPLQISNAGSGAGGGSKWYAPLGGAPATLPLASGLNALAAGDGAVASTQEGIAFGRLSSATGGAGAVAIGLGATAGNESTIAIGTGATSTIYLGGIALGIFSNAANAAVVAIGAYATPTKIASIALGSDARTYNCFEIGRRDGYVGGRSLSPMAGNLTSDAAPTNLVCNLAALQIPNNTAAGFRGTVTAWRAAGAGVVGDSAMWIINGLVKQVGAVYTLVGGVAGVAGAPTWADAGAAGWTVVLNVIGNQFFITVTGQAGEVIYWESEVNMVTTSGT